MASTLDLDFFNFLKQTYPNDWELADFNILPIDSEGRSYSTWKEVYENYVPRFSTVPQDIFDLMILYIPIDKIFDFIDKYCEFDPNGCNENKNFWKLLWIRDINDNPPNKTKKLYLKFLEDYYGIRENYYKLFIIVYYGAIKLLPSLIEKYIDISRDNYKIFRYAAELGKLDIVKYFISLGADISIQNYEALRLAAKNGHLDVVKFLISIGAGAGADISAGNYEALLSAAVYNHSDVVNYLLSQIPDKSVLSVTIRDLIGIK